MKQWMRLVIVTMTVGGGFAGILATLSLFHLNDLGPLLLGSIIAFLLLYSFVLVSGLLFVQDPRCTGPLLTALAIQIPWISTPILAYKFAAGFYIAITVGRMGGAGNVGIHLGGEFLLGSIFKFALSQNIPVRIGLNLWALLLFILSWKSIQSSDSISQPS